MNEEIPITDARQGDHRRMNMRVLFWGVPAAAILLAAIAIFWMQPG